MAKVLIITYYWPPAGGPGVQRALKFSKYLPDFGWQPIILTVENGEFPAIDPTLEKEVSSACRIYRTKIFHPHLYYKKFVGMQEDEKIPIAVLTEEETSWKKRIANWLRSNLFVPDARVGWLPFAVKEGKKIINNEKPQIIFSTSPPPTVHLIASKLAKWSGIKWVADFRDPWTNIYHYDKVSKNIISRMIDKRLEKNVLKRADKITSVNQDFFRNSVGLNKIIQITNGYDSADMEKIVKKKTANTKFIIRYMGSLKIRQYVDSFFAILNELSENEEYKRNIQFELIGYVDPVVLRYIEDKNILIKIKTYGYLNHDKAIELAANADILLLLVAKSPNSNLFVSGKLFEYIMVQKPLLAFGPLNGSSDNIIKKFSEKNKSEYSENIRKNIYYKTTTT